MNQDNIDTFAKATFGGYNIIHEKDAESKGSPFGKPIVQGMFILAIIDNFSNEVLTKRTDELSLKYMDAGINYGFNKIRFISPVYVDSKLRGIYKLVKVGYGNKKNTIRYVMDIVVQAKNKETGIISTACAAQWIGMVIYKI